jgi:hypothetical protein
MRNALKYLGALLTVITLAVGIVLALKEPSTYSDPNQVSKTNRKTPKVNPQKWTPSKKTTENTSPKTGEPKNLVPPQNKLCRLTVQIPTHAGPGGPLATNLYVYDGKASKQWDKKVEKARVGLDRRKKLNEAMAQKEKEPEPIDIKRIGSDGPVSFDLHVGEYRLKAFGYKSLDLTLSDNSKRVMLELTERGKESLKDQSADPFTYVLSGEVKRGNGIPFIQAGLGAIRLYRDPDHVTDNVVPADKFSYGRPHQYKNDGTFSIPLNGLTWKGHRAVLVFSSPHAKAPVVRDLGILYGNVGNIELNVEMNQWAPIAVSLPSGFTLVTFGAAEDYSKTRQCIEYNQAKQEIIGAKAGHRVAVVVRETESQLEGVAFATLEQRGSGFFASCNPSVRHVKGRLLDRNGDPVVNGTVFVEGHKTPYDRGIATDKKGYFECSFIKEGKILVYGRPYMVVNPETKEQKVCRAIIQLTPTQLNAEVTLKYNFR